MMSSCAVEVILSTADWASSGSVMMANHSSGLRLEVSTVEALLVSGHDKFVEVGGRGGVHGLQGEVVDDQQSDLGPGGAFRLRCCCRGGMLLAA